MFECNYPKCRPKIYFEKINSMTLEKENIEDEKICMETLFYQIN